MEKLGRRLLPEARRDFKAALDAAEAGTVPGAHRAQILHALGWVETQMGRLRPSVAYHERALQLLPPSDRAADLFNVAQAYRELGDAREAERYAREALKLSPEDPRLLRLLGSVLIQQRKYPEAESVSQRALARGDATITAMVWSDLAVIAEARGRYAPAAEMLERAITGMTPSQARARALSNLSTIEQRLKRYREAVKHGRLAVEEMEAHTGPRHPDLCTVLERYADVLRHSGHSEQAKPIAERARHLQSLLGASVDWRSLKQ